jgi:hypothetical protein
MRSRTVIAVIFLALAIAVAGYLGVRLMLEGLGVSLF